MLKDGTDIHSFPTDSEAVSCVLLSIEKIATIKKVVRYSSNSRMIDIVVLNYSPTMYNVRQGLEPK